MAGSRGSWCVVAVCVAVGTLRAQETTVGTTDAIRIELTAADIHDLDMREMGGGGYELRTTGGDPYVFTKPLAPMPDTKREHVLAFDCFCPAGTDSFQVFFGPSPSEGRSHTGAGLGVSEGWTSYTIDLAESPAWVGDIPSLRLDFGRQSGRVIQLRNIVLRGANARERELAAGREAKREAEARLHTDLGAYLDREHSRRVTRVVVGRDEVRVSVAGLESDAADRIHLCEIPIYRDVTAGDAVVSSEPIRPGERTVVLPRYRVEPERTHDRLFSKWALGKRGEDGFGLLSHARHADDEAIEGARSLPVARPRSRKGIGGFSVERHDGGSDADALGIGYVTVNVVLSYMRPGPGEDTIAFEFCGRPYYVHRPTIERYDRTMRFCAARDIVVSAIILIPKADGFAQGLGPIFMHPDCDPKGIFSMANVTCPEGLDYYAAAIDFLAERYSREDGEFGRIHHWIVHNEVDAGWVWTNAGHKTLRLYTDLYHRSLRVVHCVARKYDRHARAYASLTHHWTWAYDTRFFGSKGVLETLARFSTLEGDFDWGIAYHPYPESLRNPRCWEDKKVDFSFDTPLITFKNIEVLAAWVERPAMMVRGTRRRSVHLSEQGPNSPDYREESLRDQAACMAFAWQKIKPLGAIEAFQYHNWIDNRHEGGLRIGLRKFPGEEHKAAPKPIWHVFQKLDTPDEDAACEFAKDVLGIQSWDEVRHTEPIR